MSDMQATIHILSAILFGVTGLAFGSFFNVLVWRLPRNESVVSPPSHCPSCNAQITWYQNIPVLSWLFLGGKCASCKVKISVRYPVVELITGLLALVLWYRVGQFLFVYPGPSCVQTISVIASCLFLLLLFPMSLIDIEHYIIPDSISLGGLAAGLLVATIAQTGTDPWTHHIPLESILGVLAGGGTLFLVGWLGEIIFKKEEAMGGGDVKLMAAAGAFFGWKAALMAIVIGAFAGAIISVAMILIGKMKRESLIPFGPFLAVGIWLSALYGSELLDGYWELMNMVMPF